MQTELKNLVLSLKINGGHGVYKVPIILDLRELQLIQQGDEMPEVIYEFNDPQRLFKDETAEEATA